MINPPWDQDTDEEREAFLAALDEEAEAQSHDDRQERESTEAYDDLF